MSKTRRDRRKQQRIAEKHFSKLSNLLGDFYEFLEKSPKPSDEDVRNKFIASEKQWKEHCSKHQLKDSAYLLFNQEVALSWKSRYARTESIQK